MKMLRSAAVVLVCVALAVAAWLHTSETAGAQQAQQGLQRALATYAVARTLNATLSVLKSTELAAEPAGVGVAVGVGQLLDPLDDLIEQFSSLMLTVLLAYGLQLLMIKIGAHWLVSLLLSLALAGAVACTVARRALPGWLKRTALALLLVRFGVPVYAVGSELVFEQLLHAQYSSAQQGLQQSGDALEQAPPDAAAAPDTPASAPGVAKRWYERLLPEAVSHLPRLPDAQAIRAMTDRAVARVIDLAVVFVWQVAVQPLLFLLLAVAAWRWAGRPGAGPDAGGGPRQR